MSRILILGIKGTLGQALEREFVSGADEVVGWDRAEADATDPRIKEKIFGLKPEIIINATGYNAVDKAESDAKEKESAFALNAGAPKMLAEAAKELGAVFVNYSTDYVFKGDKKDGYEEADEPKPQSVYGLSKHEGEKNVAEAGGKYYIIRLSRLFGQKGESERSKKSFVEIMLGKKDEPEIKLVNEERSCPTYAPDLARFTAELVSSDKPYGIYHGANSGACTWYEWAREIFKIIGASPKLTPISGAELARPAKRPLFSELINTKMPVQRGWQEALKEFLSDF